MATTANPTAIHGTSESADEVVRVVVVDDDTDTRDSLKVLIELDGYSVHTAATAEEARQLVRSHEPECVILDLGLPGESGIDLAACLRADFGSGMVMIVLTGSSDPDEHMAAEAAGVDYILRKPLNIERFRRIVPPLH
jgi:DNA-binding response OmpR family regulator